MSPYSSPVLNASSTPVAGNTSAYGWIYLFQGGRLDTVTGWYEFGARDLIPSEGRWAERDPLGFGGGQLDIYGYEGDDPTNKLDPSGLEGVGHHWVPVSVLSDPEIRPLLSNNAYRVGMGAYTGVTDPQHNYRSQGGVAHNRYNQVVKQELQTYINKNNIEKMSSQQMFEFVNRIRGGRGADGEINKELSAFNNAVEAERQRFLAGNPKRGFKEADCVEVWLKRGKRYLQGPRFWSSAIGSSMLGAASDALGPTVQVLDAASGSQHFRDGVGYLAAGDLENADREFIGDGSDAALTDDSSFVGELASRDLAKAALAFRKSYLDAQARARENLMNAMPDD